MDKFKKTDLEFYLPDSFKGLPKKYMLDCIFNDNLQKRWSPSVGDIIIGCTGNVFVISGFHDAHEQVGGKTFFFGGNLCSRDGGIIMNETHCFVLNEDGMNYTYTSEGIEKREDFSYSKFSDFRFVPYPHELK